MAAIPALLTIEALHQGYRAGAFTAGEVAAAVLARIAACPDQAIWLAVASPAELQAQVAGLPPGGPDDRHPLWGVPVGVKDNIDCAGFPTTAACPEFSYRPAADATVVARLRAAGALIVGKTNLDQFATGLNGTRSPYGAPRSVFSADHISGGSSSGSGVAVARGQVAVALGTDTAGSGRVPAAFNNVVGIKPTKGLLPVTGVVPACRSLDCVSVFAASVAEGDRVRRILEGPDGQDAYARRGTPCGLPAAGWRVGVPRPDQREFYGDEAYAALFEQTIARVAGLGATIVAIDFAPFAEAAKLLYGGPWVAERLAAIADFFAAHEAAVDPSVRAIIGRGRTISAVEAFRGAYALAELQARATAEWAGMDALLLPTAPTIYTVAALQADPLLLNVRLGHYTNFVNLLDCCAIAVPAGFRDDGLPFGATLVAPAFADGALAVLADGLHRALSCGLGADRGAALPGAPPPVPPVAGLTVAVVGAHLSGQPLNAQLTGAGGRLVETARTAADYRLYALAGTSPAKPGLVRSPGFAGPGLEVELWCLAPAAFGTFVAAVPAPMTIGKITLADGRQVSGFLCEPAALAGAAEITGFGGWRAYLAQ